MGISKYWGIGYDINGFRLLYLGGFAGEHATEPILGVSAIGSFFSRGWMFAFQANSPDSSSGEIYHSLKNSLFHYSAVLS